MAKGVQPVSCNGRIGRRKDKANTAQFLHSSRRHSEDRMCRQQKAPSWNHSQDGAFLLWIRANTARQSRLQKSRCSSNTCFGGGEGSRTPVRKRFNRTFSGRSYVSTFPPRAGTQQTARFSRVMMRGRGNSYPPHGRHINDAFPGLWPLRFRRSQLKLRRQQY